MAVERVDQGKPEKSAERGGQIYHMICFFHLTLQYVHHMI
jgi:hypothetical protein